MANILLCHDEANFAYTRAAIWKEVYGHIVSVCTSAAESLSRARRGLSDIDIALFHKDLGLGRERYGAGDVIRVVQEESPWIRVGVISGEFPDGEQTVVREYQADFYLPTVTNYDDPWLLQQLNSGYVNEENRRQRGRRVEMPPHASSREKRWF